MTLRLKARCNGCGRTDLPTTAYRCVWPDQRVTVERHCQHCRLLWQRQLKWLGATIEELPGDEARPGSIQTSSSE